MVIFLLLNLSLKEEDSIRERRKGKKLSVIPP